MGKRHGWGIIGATLFGLAFDARWGSVSAAEYVLAAGFVFVGWLVVRNG
jgi:hypothetical protein